MIDVEGIVDDTKERIEAMRQQAMHTLMINQECFVAAWIMQNPFEKVSDYMLKFYPEEGNPNVYGVRMEKVDVQ